MSGETLTIVDNGDGTFDCSNSGGSDSSDDDQSQDQPQTLNSAADVCQWVQQELSGDDPQTQGKAMWQQEAAKRSGGAASRGGGAASAGAPNPIQSM